MRAWLVAVLITAGLAAPAVGQQRADGEARPPAPPDAL